MTKIATLAKNEQTGKWEAKFNGQVIAASNDRNYVVTAIETGRCNKANKLGVSKVVEVQGEMMVESSHGVYTPPAERFSINERFDFLEGFVKMTAKRVLPSLVVTGQGGLGKTFTVHAGLKAHGLINASDNTSIIAPTDEGGQPIEVIGVGTDSNMTPEESRKYYTVIKGYSTPKGLYKLLYENRNRILMFDDCDAILRDPVALNLLKGALDSYDRRIISWASAGMIDDGLPTQFEFKGGVIFISNLAAHKIDQAIRSRSICVDLSMNVDEKIERMSVIVQSEGFLPEIEMETKELALQFLTSMKNKATEISFRTLIQVAKIASQGGNWESPAEYFLTSSN